jgi:hypothetical protein
LELHRHHKLNKYLQIRSSTQTYNEILPMGAEKFLELEKAPGI